MKWLIFGLGTAVLIFLWGCSEITTEPNPDPEPRFGAFDRDFGLKFEAVGDTLVYQEEIEITTRVKPEYSGTGWLNILGHAGGNIFGQVTSPVQEELGTITLPLIFEKGVITTQPIILLTTYDTDYVAFTVSVGFDSVLVDSTLYFREDPELYQHFASPLVIPLSISSRETFFVKEN